MVFTKKQVVALLDSVEGVRDLKVVEVQDDFLTELHTESDDVLKDYSDALVTIGKGVISNTLVVAAEHGLQVKSPSVRAYLSLDETSDVPYVKITISGTPSFKFEFKESLDTRLDADFKEDYLTFLEYVVYKFVSTAIAYENVQGLNEIVEEIKSDITSDELAVEFDFEFALSDKPISYISNDSLVLGTTVENMHNLVSPNSNLEPLFSDNEEVEYIKDALKASIIEDWVTSPNPLVFIRKHNKYLLPLVTGELNTRRTKRVDVLIRNSFTLKSDSLKHRKKAIAHKLEKDGDETYISVFDKKSKDEEPVEVLSPVNVKSLTYKG